MPEWSINFFAAILIGETSYLFALATTVHEIDLQLYAVV
jgi:hypothetical protein